MAVNGGRPSMRRQRSILVDGDFLWTLLITILLFLTSTPCARSQGIVTQCYQPYLHCWKYGPRYELRWFYKGLSILSEMLHTQTIKRVNKYWHRPIFVLAFKINQWKHKVSNTAMSVWSIVFNKCFKYKRYTGTRLSFQKTVRQVVPQDDDMSISYSIGLIVGVVSS